MAWQLCFPFLSSSFSMVSHPLTSSGVCVPRGMRQEPSPVLGSPYRSSCPPVLPHLRGTWRALWFCPRAQPRVHLNSVCITLLCYSFTSQVARDGGLPAHGDTCESTLPQVPPHLNVCIEGGAQAGLDLELGFLFSCYPLSYPSYSETAHPTLPFHVAPTHLCPVSMGWAGIRGGGTQLSAHTLSSSFEIV